MLNADLAELGSQLLFNTAQGTDVAREAADGILLQLCKQQTVFTCRAERSKSRNQKNKKNEGREVCLYTVLLLF